MPGSVFKHRASGKWVCKVNGRFHYFGTRAEAQDYRYQQATHPAEVAGVGPQGSRRLTVADFFSEWFVRQEIRVRTGKLRRKTYTFYRMLYRNYIGPHIGSVRMWEITAKRLDALYLALLDKGLSGTTAHAVAGLLRLAFKFAKRNAKVILENRAEDAEIPAIDTKEKRAFDFEQARLFLGAAKRSKHYRIYLAAISNGFREEDICGLRWCDVDFVQGAAFIRQVIYPDWGSKKEGRKVEWYIGKPKTKAGIRAVKLIPEMVTELQALREEQARLRERCTICPDGKDCRRPHCPHWHDLDLVFCQSNGKWLHLSNITRGDYRNVLKAARLPFLTLHELRHSHVTQLDRLGASQKIIQTRVGHADARMTLHYTHADLVDQEPVVLRLQDALFPPTPAIHRNSGQEGGATETGAIGETQS